MSAMQDLTPGLELAGRFKLKRRLGRGGISEVWLAADASTGRDVALKLFASDAADPATRERLAAEWRHLDDMNHPNIVRPHGWFDDDGRAFFVMDACLGGDMRRFIGRPFEAWAEPLLELVDALAHLHERGLVHRDVKASNVLLDEDGHAALADFGVAGTIGGSLRSGGSMYGMSPQQLDGAPPSQADDLYALGALIYELMTGSPPLHPDLTPERLRDEMPAPPGDGPLCDLAMSLLAKSPSDRPGSVVEVRRALETLTGTSVDNATIPPLYALPDDDVPNHVEIRPSSVRVDAPVLAAESPAPSSTPRATQWVFAWAMMATLGLLAFVVFVFLPDSVEKRRAANPAAPVVAKPAPTAEADDPSSPAVATTRVGLSPYQLAELAAKRERAERELTALIRTQERLEARNVSVWGETAFTEARDLAADGDALFRERRYDEAAQKYAEAAAQMDELLGSADAVLSDALAAAWAAFDDGDAEDAAGRFQYVREIDPDNDEAARGLARTANLDALVALIDDAERLEAAGSLTAARARFREAVELDGDYAPAVAGVARVGERIADASFNELLSRGYAALEKKDYGTARQAFAAAAGRRPGSSAAKAGLEQVELAGRLGTIQSLRADAEAHESAERWAQAVASYDALLETDDTLVFARQGRERASRRAALDKRLRELVDNPERLATDSVYNAAVAIMEEASAVPSPGPVLADQQRRLARLIATARTPIAVTLLSDNQTNVVLYKVDRLGRFERRELNLRPGKYTVVGSRTGYRDVRREFTLIAGQEPDPVIVKCEERI